MRDLLLSFALLAACGPKATTADDTTVDADTADATCGGQHLDLTYVPPNLEIVLDRSCSMKNLLSDGVTTKWQAAVAALTHVLTTFGTDVRWGMTMFPDITGDSCTQDAIPFPIADNNGGPIQSMLSASLSETDPNYPKGPCVTNIDTGIEQAATDPALSATNRSSFLMLVSDGAQAKCSAGGGNAGAEDAIHTLFHDRHVGTFVVGFGSSVDDDELTKLANKGGVPNGGPKPYYQADTAAELDAVFQQIANQVVSCSYTVNQTPPSLDQTYVIYDGTTLVPRDQSHAAGWDYDEATMTLTLYGSYCDQLKAHTVTSVDVEFGCPTPPIL